MKIFISIECLRGSHEANIQDYFIEMSRFFISFTWENFPRWLRVYFDICMSDEPPKDQSPTENYPTYLSQPLPEVNHLKIAERILDQALAFVEDEAYLSTPAHEAMHSETDSGNGQLINTHCEHSQYPNEELEHLATRSFCQALDYFAEGKDKECRRWSRKSIKLAECMDNEKGPALVKDLRERLRSCME